MESQNKVLNEELKPCPFCGQKAEIIREVIVAGYDYYLRYHVGCVNPNCMVQPQTRMKAFEEGIPEMIELWNRRFYEAE